MKRVPNSWLLPALFAFSTACLDTATNKDEILPPINNDASPSTGGGNAGGGANHPGGGGNQGGDDGSNTDDNGGGDGTDSSGDDSNNDTDAGGGSSGDDGPAESRVAGTASTANCKSYTQQTATSCYGYYCGVDEATLAAEFSPTRKCDYPVEDACAGLLSQKVGACARMVKSQNPIISEADHRKQTVNCVYGDQHLKDTVSMDCLDCYVDAAMCASKHCTLQCLAGDSDACDECRMKNNCNQPVPACAELPSPF